MPVKDDDAIYPIGVAAKLLDVHPRTLRIYEDAGLITPARRGNKRYFSNNNLEWVRCLRSLIHEHGINVTGLAMLLKVSPCWEIKNCPAEERENCTAFKDDRRACWKIARSACAERKACQSCEVYLEAVAVMKKGSQAGEDPP